MDRDEIRTLGYCEQCGIAITDENEAYIDNEGRYFDCLDCLFEYHNITKVEC
jgi:hypothetical protein